jgi:hypothetical protein
MMEMVGSRETSVHFYQTVQCHIPENINLHYVSWENEISHGKYGCGYMKGESRYLSQEWNFVLSQQLTYHMLYHLPVGGSIRIQMAITQNNSTESRKRLQAG